MLTTYVFCIGHSHSEGKYDVKYLLSSVFLGVKLKHFGLLPKYDSTDTHCFNSFSIDVFELHFLANRSFDRMNILNLN